MRTPYADDASNNEAQNLNTKTVNRGDKLVYQVWLDTTKFDAANKDNIQSVGSQMTTMKLSWILTLLRLKPTIQ